MRYLPLLCCFCFFASPVLAQTADWKSFGRPLDDDTKAMADRFVFMNDDAVDKNVGPERALMSQQQVFDWVRERVSQILTLDGTRYPAQMVTNRVLFTAKGYGDYQSYLNDINMGKFLIGNQFKTVAYLDGEPFLTNQGLTEIPAATTTDGKTLPAFKAYMWQIKARVIMSYLDYRNQPPAVLFKNMLPDQINNRFPLEVTLELIRVPQTKDNQLAAINAISFNTVK